MKKAGNARLLANTSISAIFTQSYLSIGRFYTRGRIIRLDELGQTFVIRLVIRL